MRILFQIIEFYWIIILTNNFIEYILIFISSCNNNNGLMKFISFIFCSIFTYISTFPLTLYYYEFSNLSWIKNQGFCQFLGFDRDNDKKNDSLWFEYVICFIFILDLFIYLWLPNNKETEKNYIFFLLLTLFPLLKIICIYISALKNFFEQPNKDTNYLFYIAQKSKGNSNKMKLKIGLGFFSFLYYLIICLDKGIKWGNFIVIFSIHIFTIPIFISIEIQPWLFHSFSKKCFCCTKDYIRIKNENTLYHKINQKSKSLKFWNNISLIFYIVMILIFLLNFITFLFQSSNRNNTIQNQLNFTQNFTGIPWKEEKKVQEIIY